MASLAREAVDGMFQLCEEELSDKPFLDGLRRRLLQDYFLVYYQKLIDQRRDDPTAQAELSRNCRVQDILDKLAVLQGVRQYHLLNDPDVVRDLQTDDEQLEKIRDLKKERGMGPWGFGDCRRSRLQRFLDDAWMESQAQNIS